MSENVTINQGGKLFVCATAQNTTLTQVGFEGLTWVEIECVVTMPAIGVTENIVSQDCISADISTKRKGLKSGNSTEIVVAMDYEDAGQDALYTASLTKSNYAFKREYTDSPNVATTTNTITYFRALVGQRVDTGGGVEDFVNYTYPLEINGQLPITVEPEAI